eukprot:COSAG01_NODE_27390_length_687_cov_0.801020_1_plen_91_part_10
MWIAGPGDRQLLRQLEPDARDWEPDAKWAEPDSEHALFYDGHVPGVSTLPPFYTSKLLHFDTRSFLNVLFDLQMLLLRICRSPHGWWQCSG